MKNLLTQIIVILLILTVGLLLLKFYSAANVAQIEQIGNLKTENAVLQKEKDDLSKANEGLLQENKVLGIEKAQLELANRYLKTDFRKARIEVLEQKFDSANPQKVLETKIRFTEFDSDTGSIVARPAEFTVRGDMIYVDALIVKFDDVFVEAGDFLKNRSLVSFQRIFGEEQAPSDGYRIDAEHQIPAVYRSGNENDEASELEKQIWENFWDISNDPERQKELGIRAIHGEAPAQRLEPGRLYYLELRASGGLSFRVE
ncbi:MAG: hypothetical protein E7028_09900 [Planctomycetaceae bacterium]|nr:hypothetical protein [Planctomycetaceae bacterium]